jgi:hypothetical protein
MVREYYSPRHKRIIKHKQPDDWQEIVRKTIAASHGCEDCGEWRWLDVHHSDRDYENNSTENLIVLCPNCHRARHGIPNIRTVCVACQREFIAVGSYVRQHGIPKWCSQDCRRSKVTVKCKECNKPIEITHFEGKTRRKQYCDRLCCNRAMAKRRWGHKKGEQLCLLL